MPECEYADGGKWTCERLFNCCSCGGVECGCPYCWDCNACDTCRAE